MEKTPKNFGGDSDSPANPSETVNLRKVQDKTNATIINAAFQNVDQSASEEIRGNNGCEPKEGSAGEDRLEDVPEQSPDGTEQLSKSEEAVPSGDDNEAADITVLETVGLVRVPKINKDRLSKPESKPEMDDEHAVENKHETNNSDETEKKQQETDIAVVSSNTPQEVHNISSVSADSKADNVMTEIECKDSEENGLKEDIYKTIKSDTPDSEKVNTVSEDMVKGTDKVVMFEDTESEAGVSSNITGLPRSPTSTIRELAPSRNSDRTMTTETDFVYDENEDFRTPDFYDRYLHHSVTPSTTESEKIRQEAGSRRNLLSRGESSKSVTFADEVTNQKATEVDKDGDDTGGGEEGDNGVKNEKTDEKSCSEEEKEGVFSTAVSSEKIEEATARAKGKANSTSDDLWGQTKLGLETMGDVISKRATEHFEKGCKLSDQGDNCQAILAFDKAINLCPKIVTYYLARGEAYIQICDFQSAILNLKKACVLDPDNDKYYSKLAFVYYFYGQTLFDQNLFAEALEAFSRASEMRPEVVGYHTRGVACLGALQRHGECLALVNKRLEMEQDDSDLYIMRARLHLLFRNTSLCYYDLRDAISLDPDQEEACMLMNHLIEKAQDSRNHSVRLQLQGKLKEALNKITTAIETNPSVAEYHLLRGALYRRLQDYNAAIDDYLLALDKTEHNEDDHIYTESQRQLLLTYNDFAVECFLGKHYEEAIILLNKALKGEKREKGLYINRGDCFFRLTELHFALADYHQALELDSADWHTHSRIASIHNEFGLMDYEEHIYPEAEARFTLAIQHNPRKGSYYIYRAKVRFMLENHTDARQDLLMALHLDPSNDDILSLMPRLFPGKTVGDVIRSKNAKVAKTAVDNALVTASPIKLPEMPSGTKGTLPMTLQASDGTATAKHVAFAVDGIPPREPSSSDFRSCMNEMQFNKALSKNKKKISNHVKSLLHDRKSLSNSPLTLAPQPPALPHTFQGGGWKKSDTEKPAGWKTFSLGMGIMNK